MEYLGCDLNTFRQHIESKFQAGMEWSNYAIYWNFDHVVPIHYRENGVKPTLQQKEERLHYTNIQPMLIEENRRKGNRHT